MNLGALLFVLAAVALSVNADNCPYGGSKVQLRLELFLKRPELSILRMKSSIKVKGIQ